MAPQADERHPRDLVDGLQAEQRLARADPLEEADAAVLEPFSGSGNTVSKAWTSRSRTSVAWCASTAVGEVGGALDAPDDDRALVAVGEVVLGEGDVGGRPDQHDPRRTLAAHGEDAARAAGWRSAPSGRGEEQHERG